MTRPLRRLGMGVLASPSIVAILAMAAIYSSVVWLRTPRGVTVTQPVPITLQYPDGRLVNAVMPPGKIWWLIRSHGDHAIIRIWVPTTGYQEFEVPASIVRSVEGLERGAASVVPFLRRDSKISNPHWRHSDGVTYNGAWSLQVTLVRSNPHMTAYITRGEVHETADQIDADGRKPSAKAVREITKRGSYSTIETHLATWTPRDQRLDLPPIPEGLKATVGGLIGDLWHIALGAARQLATAEIERAVAEAAEARAAAAQAGEHADRLAADLAAAQQRIAELEQTVAERDQQIKQGAKQIHDRELEVARKDGKIESLRHALAQFTPAQAGALKSAMNTADQQPAS